MVLCELLPPLHSLDVIIHALVLLIKCINMDVVWDSLHTFYFQAQQFCVCLICKILNSQNVIQALKLDNVL